MRSYEAIEFVASHAYVICSCPAFLLEINCRFQEAVTWNMSAPWRNSAGATYSTW